MLLVGSSVAPVVSAIGSPDPQQSGSVGLEGTISSPPPTQAPTISVPSNGQTFTISPITVSGLCKSGLLVKVFSNNVFVGSVMCNNGSYSLQAGLFSGQNDLVARLYDALDQAGPDSNLVTVTYNSASFIQFGTQLILTSHYARRGANPGALLTWPIILTGGEGPYALSVDWGDASGNDVLSETFAGTINISHTYHTAGVYEVVIKASDHNGETAYLQVVAIANGAISSNGSGKGASGGITKVIGPPWYIYLIPIPLLLFSFWLGGRSELYIVRKRLEHSRQLAEE
jgi:hypothetical protein